jgi:integral membrane sensor domain MASE1
VVLVAAGHSLAASMAAASECAVWLPDSLSTGVQQRFACRHRLWWAHCLLRESL